MTRVSTSKEKKLKINSELEAILVKVPAAVDDRQSTATTEVTEEPAVSGKHLTFDIY